MTRITQHHKELIQQEQTKLIDKVLSNVIKETDEEINEAIFKEFNRSLHIYGIGCMKDGKVKPIQDIYITKEDEDKG
jgi:hypothetical protein